jgi:hypothetical protein
MRVNKSVYLFILLFIPVVAFTQQVQTISSTGKNEAALNAARTKVLLNEKKLVAADSLIAAGKKMLDESKDEIKAIDAESKNYEKEFSVRYKAVKKLSGSKDKAEAKKALADIRTLDIEHRNTNRVFETRMNTAYRKQATALTTIDKGQKAKASAKDALQVANDALKSAQEKYDAETGAAPEKGKGKNK